MKLFQTKRGMIIAFGFDMLERKPNPAMVCWNDPETGSWDVGEAGSHKIVGLNIAPEFIREHRGCIVVYQQGCLIEMNYLGVPLVWGFNFTEPQ